MLSAVITADIVNSTRLPRTELRKLMQGIEAALTPYLHEFYRGDSFQVFVPAAEEAFALVVQLRVLARKAAPDCDIRCSLGLGPMKTRPKVLRTATDEVFVRSGRRFDSLKEGERLAILATDEEARLDSGYRLLAAFTDHLLMQMTQKQAAVVLELLQGKNQVETAKKLKKSQATVNKHVQAAGWPALEKLLAEYRILTGSIAR